MIFLRRSFQTVDRPAFFVARPRESGSDLQARRLERYEDLLDVDLDALARDGKLPDGEPIEGPLLLVCTHGRHDRCCARHGHPFYRRLVSAAASEPGDERVWQSSHIGGDRFAANLAWFPWGVFYGRLDIAGDPDRLLEACGRGEILLDRYRGRSCHPFHVQAAETFVRREWDELAPDGVRLVGVESAEAAAAGEARWRVRLAGRGGRTATVEVARAPSDFTLPSTCGADGSRRVPIHRLVALEETTAPAPEEGR